MIGNGEKKGRKKIEIIIINLVEFILLAKFHTLLPAVVAFEKVGGNSSEFDELVLLQALGQRYVIKVVIGVDGCTQSLCDTQERQRGREKKEA